MAVLPGCLDPPTARIYIPRPVRGKVGTPEEIVRPGELFPARRVG
jgi:hypothetical protein